MNYQEAKHCQTIHASSKYSSENINNSKHDRMGLDWTSMPGPDGTKVPIPMESQIELHNRQIEIRDAMEAYLTSQGLKKR